MNQDNKRIFLAHWTYTHEEWKAFIRWDKSRRGIWHYWWFRVSAVRRLVAPEIAITHQKIWIGDEVQTFRGKEKQLKKIHIRDEGKMNILEISFENLSGSQATVADIRIPIPKGKLREAIQVHDSLSIYA